MTTKRDESARRKHSTDLQTPVLDFSYANAVPLVLRRYEELTLCLVGCGGSGSWLAPHVARLARLLCERNKTVHVLFFDPDIVEERNIARQHFCFAEIGQPKALTLAARYNAALGPDIRAVVARFDAQMVPAHVGWNKLVVLIGCVDNAAARQQLANALNVNAQTWMSGATPSTWWLDGGNARESGQVLLGSETTCERLREAFPMSAVCAALPAPSLQQPKLLEALPEEAMPTALSCVELVARNAQSLSVNQTVAAIASDYLVRLLLAHDLRRFATYFDLASGSMRSQYITPQTIAATVGQSVHHLFSVKRKQQ